jgi:hypothetical protein
VGNNIVVVLLVLVKICHIMNHTPTTILVTIFHICTCDDVTLVNEKSIVSWKYMKSNKKCVFNVNFQYNHKQVPTAYFSMMFNIHKHISHLIFVLVPECGEYEICNQKIILRSISRLARANIENCYQNSSWGKGLIKSRNNESYTFHL